MNPTPNTGKYEINKELAASTCHITKADSERLGAAPGNEPLIVYPYEFGWFIYAFSNDPALDQERLTAVRQAGYSDALVGLLRIAQSEGCKFLTLDRDAPEYDNLPRFDW